MMASLSNIGDLLDIRILFLHGTTELYLNKKLGGFKN